MNFLKYANYSGNFYLRQRICFLMTRQRVHLGWRRRYLYTQVREGRETCVRARWGRLQTRPGRPQNRLMEAQGWGAEYITSQFVFAKLKLPPRQRTRQGETGKSKVKEQQAKRDKEARNGTTGSLEKNQAKSKLSCKEDLNGYSHNKKKIIVNRIRI